MKTTDLWDSKEECCGCELCSQSCPRSVIEMKTDEEGFLYPYVVHSEKCINCSRCVNVCPSKSSGREPSGINHGYGGYNNDVAELKSCSSGGFASAVSYRFIKQIGGVVYGVRYSDDFSYAEYGKAEEVEDLDSFKGSKYVQARKGLIYNDILENLKEGRPVLFIGLPCDISAVYHHVGRQFQDKLYTIALICHGPTSNLVQHEYSQRLEKKYKSSISSFSVRYKNTGWKPYFINATFANGKHYRRQFDFSDYGIAFQYMKRPSCSVCQYKYGNKLFGTIADVTIGDYHSAQKGTFEYNKWGVSQACTHTEKGGELIFLLNENCTLFDIPKSKLAHSNRAFFSCIPQKPERNLFVSILKKTSLHRACSHNEIYYPYITGRVRKRILMTLVRIRSLLLEIVR